MKVSTVSREQQLNIAALAAADNVGRGYQRKIVNGVCKELSRIVKNSPSESEYTGKQFNKTWSAYATKLITQLKARSRPDRFKIFKEGNSKLDFYTFSTVPIASCAGMGACEDWCYSLLSWRYPAAFLGQVQNTILLNNKRGRAYITEAFNKLPQDITLRLYVDGDFKNTDQVAYWQTLLKTRPNINAYGYSKSWKEFVQFAKTGTFADNYMLNTSSGSIHGALMRKAMSKLDVTRGNFVAVQVDPKYLESSTYQRNNKTVRSAPYQDRYHPLAKAYQHAVRLAARKDYGKKVYACPGKCGNCLPNNIHACGSRQMQDVTIAIGIH
jgi:hypothetical protein